MSLATTAKDVMNTLEQKVNGSTVGVGGCMVFEVSQDFGMDKNKSVNLLVAK